MRSHGLKHCPFCNFLKERKVEFPDLPFHISVKWLSCTKILARILSFELELKYLKPENHFRVLFKDSERLWKLAFSVDLTLHFNDFNVQIQDETLLICYEYLYSKVKAFHQKLNYLRVSQ